MAVKETDWYTCTCHSETFYSASTDYNCDHDILAFELYTSLSTGYVTYAMIVL